MKNTGAMSSTDQKGTCLWATDGSRATIFVAILRTVFEEVYM